MTEATEKKQRRVVGRLVDGGLQILADVTPFVSSRLGPAVSCETNRERDDERMSVASAIADLRDRQ